MRNWKKEGYVKGQEVFIVSKGMFTRDVNFQTGIVTHAGTKILKVKIGEQKRNLEFKNSNFVNGGMWGYGYSLYKTKEEYEKEDLAVKYRWKLRLKATDCLCKLTNEQLEQIIEWSKKE